MIMVSKIIICCFLILISLCSCINKNNANNATVPCVENKAPDYSLIYSDTIPFIMNDNFGTGFNEIIIEGITFNKNLVFLLDNGWHVSGFTRESAQSFIDMSKFHKKEDAAYEYYFPNDPAEQVIIKLKDYLLELDSINVNIENNPYRNGIIGFELFDKNIVEIDFKKRFIVLHNQLPDILEYMVLSLINMDSIKHPNEIKHKLIELDGFTDRFLLDLGAAMTIFNPAFLEKVDIKNYVQDSLSIHYYLLDYIRRGDSHLLFDENGKSFFETYNYWNIAGFIGVDFLKQFHVFFDYPANKLYLKPNSDE